MSIYVNGERLMTVDEAVPMWNLLDGTYNFNGYSIHEQNTLSEKITPYGNLSYWKDTAWNAPNIKITLDPGIYTFSFSAYFETMPYSNQIFQSYFDSSYQSMIKSQRDYAFDHITIVPNSWQRGYYIFKVLESVTVSLGASMNKSGYKVHVGDYMLTRGLTIPKWNFSQNDIRKLMK